MKKRISVLLLSATVILSVFSSCARQPAVLNSQAPVVSSAASFEQQPQPVVVTDHLNRQITLTGEAQRIVSGYYVSGSMLIALGVQDRVVAMEAKADTRPIYSLAAPQMLSLPNVGTAKQFDLEGCIAQNPDLVILPVKLKDAVESLEQMGITVLAINPESDELMREAMQMIAKATGTQQRCTEILGSVDAISSSLYASAPTEKKRVYLAGNSEFLTTATPKMYQHSQIVLAGGENVAAALTDSYWAKISYEQLIAFHPDVIVLPPAASYTLEDIYADSTLAELSAVKNKQVFQMPASIEAWDSPVPLAVLGAQWMAATLYPEMHPMDDFVGNAKELYRRYYGVAINEGQLIQ